jgi:DNA-binding transcriptional ArsR family regulator
MKQVIVMAGGERSLSITEDSAPPRERFGYDRIMADEPNIARVAALIGEPARAEILTALLADRALTATELAALAGVTKQTVSAHLAKLVDAGLLEVAAQGRHRYFRLAGADVARLLESLMGIAFRTGALRVVPGPREPALRQARVCYDHLAGELGVLAYEALLARGWLADRSGSLFLTNAGAEGLAGFGIDATRAAERRRTFCRPCLDWGERRHHLGGALGAALLERLYALGWAERAKDSRVVVFTPRGEQGLRAAFASPGDSGAPKE